MSTWENCTSYDFKGPSISVISWNQSKLTWDSRESIPSTYAKTNEVLLIAHSLSFTQEVLADWWHGLSQYGKMAARCWSAAVFSERGKGGRSFPLALQADQVSLTPRCVIPQSWHRVPKQVHFIVALPHGWAQINASTVHRAKETPQKCRPEPGCRTEREFLLNRNERWSQKKPERYTGELHLLRCRCKIWVNARLRSSFWFHINTVSFFVHI